MPILLILLGFIFGLLSLGWISIMFLFVASNILYWVFLRPDTIKLVANSEPGEAIFLILWTALTAPAIPVLAYLLGLGLRNIF